MVPASHRARRFGQWLPRSGIHGRRLALVDSSQGASGRIPPDDAAIRALWLVILVLIAGDYAVTYSWRTLPSVASSMYPKSWSEFRMTASLATA